MKSHCKSLAPLLPLLCACSSAPSQTRTSEQLTSPAARAPDWFSSARVQIHAPLSRGDFVHAQTNEDHVFWTVHRQMASRGAHVVTRHVKATTANAETTGTFWPTKVPTSQLLWLNDKVRVLSPNHIVGPNLSITSRDVLKAIVQQRPDPSAKIIGYYWAAADMAVSNNARFSRWAARKCDSPDTPDLHAPILEDPSLSCGRIVGVKGPGGVGYYMSMAKAADQKDYFHKVLKPRIGELMDRGVDGVYFDANHGPAEGDWHTNMRARFQEVYGRALPETLTADLSDEDFRDSIRLYDQINRENITELQALIHSKNPDGVTIASVHRLPRLWDPRGSTAFASLVDAPKFEWNSSAHGGRKELWGKWNQQISSDSRLKGFYEPPLERQQAFTASLIRDAALGRPSHVWLYNPTDFPAREGHSYTPFQSGRINLSTAAAVITFGGIANFYHDREELTDPALWDERFSKAVELGNVVGPKLSGATPVRYLGVHFSERERDEYLAQRATAGDSEAEMIFRVWNRSIAASLRAFELAMDRGVPVVVLNDAQLQALDPAIDPIQIIIHTAPKSRLSPAQISKLNAFSAAGRGVLDASRVVVENTGQLELARDAALSLAIDSAIASAPPPVRIAPLDSSSSQRLNYAFYERSSGASRRYLVAVTGPFSWIGDLCDSLNPHNTSWTVIEECYTRKMNEHTRHSALKVTVRGPDLPTAGTLARFARPDSSMHSIPRTLLKRSEDEGTVTLPAGRYLSLLEL